MARQQTLEGMEHPHGDKQLDELLAARRASSRNRKKWSDREVADGEAIAQLMREKGINVYVDHDHNPPLIAKLTPSMKLKIDEYEEAAEAGDEVDDAKDSKDGARYAEMAEQKATKKKQNVMTEV
jgi:hypothetical protein